MRTYISLPAGIDKTGFLKFVAYTLAGSLLWNSALTIAGMQLGYNWKQIEKYSSSLDIVAIIVIAVVKAVESTNEGLCKTILNSRF